ncbi:hypothetical protein ABPG75_001495 [Micractinium tetrahymenae]
MTGALRALLALLLLAVSGCHARGGVSTAAAALTAGEQERQILLAFAGNISNWAEVQAARQLAGWAPCTPDACLPVCLWGGVSCYAFGAADGTHVTSLELSCSGPCAAPMRGRLAPGLEGLQFLQTLDLSWNALTGTLPPQWGAAGTFLSLQVLDLQHNALAGPIPEAWAWSGGFQQIVDFQLGSNQLTGPFPSVAVTNTSFTQMQSFNIANNRFSGTLPDFWNGLIILMRVQIHNNNFSGTIPPDWGKQGYLVDGTVNNTNVLETLYMHGNQLTGSLPAAFADPGSFTALRELTLSDNPLTGPLPPAWGARAGALPALQLLNLSNAGLSGPLPEWGPGLQDLRSLVLNSNDLTGTVPASWLQLASLRDVVVAPGSPGLCAAPPMGAQFTLCSADDLLCLASVPITDGTCPGGDSDGGSGFPAAAVAVPVALVGAAAVAVAAFLGWRRRKRRAAAGPAVAEKAQAAGAPEAGPSQQGSGKLWPGQDSPMPGATGPTGTPHSGTASTAAGSASALAAAAAAQMAAEEPCMRSQSLPAEAGRPAPVPGELAPVPAMAPLGTYSPHAHHPLLAGAASAPPVLWLPRHGSGTSSGTEAGASAMGAAVAAAAAAAASGRSGGLASPPPWMPPPGHPTWDSAAMAAAAAAAAATIAAARGNYTWSPSPPSAAAQHSWGLRAAASMTAPEASPTARALPRLPPQPRGSWPPDLLARAPLEPRGSSTQTEGRSSLGRVSPDPTDLDYLLSDWEIDPESITIARRPDGTPWRLGSGGFGTVFKAFRNGVTPVAVKVLGAITTDARAVMSNSEFVQEIKLLRACRDTNILQFQGCCFKGGETLLVTEYCEGGNLAHNLRARTVGWYRRGKKIALDVARALVYLHSRRIIHLDIKSANVLLTRDGTAKVGDVGMAKIMAGDYVSGVVGTLAWSAPELLLGDRCTEKADIYSMGVVLWEIATGELPSRGQMRELMVPEDCPQEVAALINRCLASDPAARPSAVEVVELLSKAPAVPTGGVVPRLPPAGPPGGAGGNRRGSTDGERPPRQRASPAAGAGGGPPSRAGSLGLAGSLAPSAVPSVGWALGGGGSSAAPGGESTAAAAAAAVEAADPAAAAAVAALARQPSGGPASMAALSPFASALQQQGRQLSVNTSISASPGDVPSGSRGQRSPERAASDEAQTPAFARAEQPVPVRLSVKAPQDAAPSSAAQQAQRGQQAQAQQAQQPEQQQQWAQQPEQQAQQQQQQLLPSPRQPPRAEQRLEQVSQSGLPHAAPRPSLQQQQQQHAHPAEQAAASAEPQAPQQWPKG